MPASAITVPLPQADPIHVMKAGAGERAGLLTALTRALLPRMIAQKNRGAIFECQFPPLDFSLSPALRLTRPQKHTSTSFTEAIRGRDHANCGITVTALCPGPVHTEFDEGREIDRSIDEKRRETVSCMLRFEKSPHAALVLEAIERDKPLVIPGIAMKIVAMAIARALPVYPPVASRVGKS